MIWFLVREEVVEVYGCELLVLDHVLQRKGWIRFVVQDILEVYDKVSQGGNLVCGWQAVASLNFEMLEGVAPRYDSFQVPLLRIAVRFLIQVETCERQPLRHFQSAVQR